eukprot:scaffold127591_cov63-Phaeocystis_antarctica.AAC.3
MEGHVRAPWAVCEAVRRALLQRAHTDGIGIPRAMLTRLAIASVGRDAAVTSSRAHCAQPCAKHREHLDGQIVSRHLVYAKTSSASGSGSGSHAQT